MGSRRRYLAGVAGTLGAALAGCVTSDGDGTDRSQTVTGTDPATADDSGTTTRSSVVPAEGAWRSLGGTPAHVGATVDPGPGADAALDWTAAFGEHRRAREIGALEKGSVPLVDDAGVYGLSEYSNYDVDPAEFGLYAQSFSREDGSERWDRELALASDEDEAPYVQSYAAGLGSDALYAWLVTTRRYEHELVSLSLPDGSVRWRTSLPALERTPRTRQPQVVGDTCYLLGGGRVHALSTADGSVRWRSDRYLADSVAPAVTDDVIAFTTRSTDEADAPTVVALSTDDGAEQWRVDRPHGITTRPVVAGDAVLFTDGGVGEAGPVLSDVDDASVYALSLADGSEIWRRNYVRPGMEDGDQFGGPKAVAVGDERVYYAFGIRGPFGDDESGEQLERQYDGPNVVALDRATGDLAWEASPTDRGRFFAPPVLADGTLLCHHAEDDSVYALDAADGTVLGSFGEVRADRPFAVVDETVYERTDAGFRAWR